MRKATGRLLGACVLLLLLAPAARADNGQFHALQKRRNASDVNALRVWVEAFPVQSRPRAYGFAVLRFHNPLTEPQRVAVRVRQVYGGNRPLASRSLTLEPTSVTRLHIPLPGADSPLTLEIDAPNEAGIRTGLPGSASGDSAVLGIFDASRATKSAAWQAVLVAAVTAGGTSRRSAGGSARAQAAWCDSRSLPTDWRMLSGFDLLILDASPDALASSQQEALARYVAAGGYLILGGLGGVPTGPLGRMMTSRESEGRHGFGRWMATDADAAAAATTRIAHWINAWPFRGNAPGQPPYGSGIPTGFHAPLKIPGLGEVPVQVFFVLILAFAILVGPISYLWLRKRRRLAWLAVTIPLLGFLVSGAILLYGFLSEGFGIRGSVRSFTVLDQRTHEAASAVGRTLYAGISPAALVPGAGTFVAPPQVTWSSRSADLAWRVDLDAGGRIDGSALPSRTPTAFASMRVGRARERLRFRLREDGAYDVLHGPDFVPTARAGSVLLRTPDGLWYGSDASGRLVSIDPDPRSHVEALRSLVRRLAEMRQGNGPVAPTQEWRRGRRHEEPTFGPGGQHGLTPHLERAWLDRFPPGAYLARVASLPSFDDLGLDVDYEAAEHVVLGFLADEDIVE